VPYLFSDKKGIRRLNPIVAFSANQFTQLNANGLDFNWDFISLWGLGSDTLCTTNST